MKIVVKESFFKPIIQSNTYRYQGTPEECAKWYVKDMSARWNYKAYSRLGTIICKDEKEHKEFWKMYEKYGGGLCFPAPMFESDRERQKYKDQYVNRFSAVYLRKE